MSAPASRIGYACESCERRDSVSFEATATWCEDSQTWIYTDGEGHAYCCHCGPVAVVELVLPHPSDWEDAVSFEITPVALIEAADGSGSDWKSCGADHYAEAQEGERLIRAAYGVYYRLPIEGNRLPASGWSGGGLAAHIEDFDELVDARAFAARIAEGRTVADYAVEGAES